VSDGGRRSRDVRLPAAVWVAIAGITLARVLYQIAVSPYDLVADEAQYWDWSRRLEWSYYSKGPGIAWLIRASTSIFGVSEWSVRLPAALAFAVASAAAARLAGAWTQDERRSGRAALVTVALIALLPGYQLSALLMTIDAPYIACWTVAIWLAWRAYTGERDDKPSARAWAGCGLAIGLGFLFKYSMLALLPGLAWFAWRERGVARHGALARAALATTVALVCAIPVVTWNLRHDTAGLRHLLGYLEIAAGDRPVRDAIGYEPLWTLGYLGAQLAIVGPMLWLIVAGAGRWRRSPGARLAVCTSAPMLAGFLLVSLRTEVQGNWALAAYAGLVPLAACVVTDAATTGVRVAWRAAVVYGSAALVAVHAPLMVASLPRAGAFVPVHRFRGFPARAAALAPAIDDGVARGGDRTIIVAPSHNAAGLLAFYLPGRPHVASAGRLLGDRPSAYDYFADTDLAAAAASTRPAVLVGASLAQWQTALRIQALTPLSPSEPVYFVDTMALPQ
jgi:4-amino-4-deoxy-L-arabinose transferase-like glycosyltransferase